MKENSVFLVSYTPRLEGTHKVIVKFADREIQNSPYKVNVASQLRQNSRPTLHAPPTPSSKILNSINFKYNYFSSVCDPKKVRVGGRGLQPNGLRVGDNGDIQIYTEGNSEGIPEVFVIYPGNFYLKFKKKI